MSEGMQSMLGAEGCARLADAAIDAVAADTVDIEVVIHHEVEGLTRFANSQIHQNVWRDDIAATVRVVGDGGRTGVSSIHTDDPASVAAAARQACALARIAPPDPEYPGLAPAAPVAAAPVDQATVDASPDDRAAAVTAMLQTVPGEMEAAGKYRTSGSELAVFTSAGQRAYAPASSASLSLVVMGDNSSGWAEAGGRAMGDMDPTAAGETAVAKAEAGRDPIEVPAGSWPVILEAPAVATIVQFLSYLGFGGRAWLEDRAFTSGRLGEQLVDRRLSVVDDSLAPVSTGLPLDYEGTPKRRVELLRDGVAVNVVHDRHSASRAGTVSTGHGLPAPNTFGPLATDPVLQPGDGGSLQDLISGCERGLLVTRFHYTNVVHPKQTSITGMTRDGTFLIQDGRVTSGVRNLRFTQSILAALEHIDGLSTETSFATEFFQGTRCPALALPSFQFNSTTTFG